jgi:hypothetical protein
MSDIFNLAQLHEALQQLGYQSSLRENSVAVKVGGRQRPFVAVITHHAVTRQFRFTCLVARLGDVPEKNLAAFALAAMEANVRVAPFAYGLITDSDDPKEDDEEEWPVVLVHSVPIGDFSSRELSASMQSLVAALIDSRRVFDTFKAKF